MGNVQRATHYPSELTNCDNATITRHAGIMLKNNLDAYLFISEYNGTTLWEKNNLYGYKQARISARDVLSID